VYVYSVCVVPNVGGGLGRADTPSKYFYRRCKNEYEIEEEVRAQQRVIEPLMNEGKAVFRLEAYIIGCLLSDISDTSILQMYMNPAQHCLKYT
jgi:hypothetical protein